MSQIAIGKLIKVWWGDSWPKLITAAGAIGMAVGGILAGSDTASIVGWIIFGASAMLTVSGQIVDWKRVPKISHLQRTVAELEDLVEQTRQDYFHHFETQLSVLANDTLSLTDKERVSVYKHDGRAFVMLGRYSKNPEFCKRGRGTYPEGEGCIAKAWLAGEAVLDSLPDPQTEEGRYLEVLKNDWGIKKGVARDFTMKSRSFVAFALENHSPKRIAVIVFESTNAGSLDKRELKNVMDNGEAKRLVDFMESVSKLEPTPSYASKEGY